MRVKDYMVNFALQIAADDSFGYTNDYPANQWWRGRDMDCGSFMSYCLHAALMQINIDTGYEYFEPTGGYYPWNEAFLIKYCDRFAYDQERNHVGDILVSTGHTEMVTHTDPDYLTGARGDYDGKTGDYTYHTEIATSRLFGGWNWIYRLKDKYNLEIPEKEGGLDMSKIPTCRLGDVSNTVMSYQYIMRYKLGFDKQEVSGTFNEQMDHNVRFFQKEHSLYVDGIIGEKTGYEMIVRCGYEEP